MTAVVPAPFQSGYRLLDGQGVDQALAFPQVASEDSIVAATTQTQLAAYQLTAPLSRVITVATAGNGVALPKSFVGAEYTVINSGANAMTVYGNYTEAATINGVATGTGISQPAGTTFVYTCSTSGAWIQNAAAVGNVQASVNPAVTAAGTTQGGATPTTGNIVDVTTGTANQGILLPTVSNIVAVINKTGATIKIYPATSTGTIDGGSAGAAVTLTSANRGATFYNIGSDTWFSSLFGAVSS